jgi:protein-disulfide isomerase
MKSSMSNIVRIMALLPFATVLAVTAEPQTYSKQEIERIIHDYLLENPQVLVESVTRLQEKQRQEAAAAQSKAIRERGTALRMDDRDPAIGAEIADADVTLVEFFDYNCGYCKRTTPELIKLIDKDKRVRVVLKEFPILSPESMTAAKYALAVNMIDPSAYFRFHRALMEQQGQKTAELLAKVIKDVGLDVELVRKKIEDPAIARHLQDTQVLAGQLGVTGTPAFIIGDQMLASAMSVQMLEEQITALRQQSMQGKVQQKLDEAAAGQ